MIIKLKSIHSFKEMIAKSGYSNRDLGRTVGISAAYIWQIVNGSRNPSPKIAKSIVDVLGCHFDDIFFIEIDSKSNQDTQEAL